MKINGVLEMVLDWAAFLLVALTILVLVTGVLGAIVGLVFFVAIHAGWVSVAVMVVMGLLGFLSDWAFRRMNSWWK